MGMFDRLNKGSRWVTRIPEDVTYTKLSTCKPGITFKLFGLYFNTKGKFENHYNALVREADETKPLTILNLPAYMNESVEELLSDDNMIQAVNDGRCGLRTEEYLDRNQKKQIAVSWVDIE